MPQTVAVPDNVPPELVVDFDFYTLAGKAEDIQLAWAELHKGPDIVWTPHYGGYWIATRAADIQVMQVDHERPLVLARFQIAVGGRPMLADEVPHLLTKGVILRPEAQFHPQSSI